MADKLIDIKKEEKPDERIGITNQIVNVSRRIQLMETKLTKISSKNLIFENNFIDFSGKIKEDMTNMNKEISDLKLEVQKTNDTLKLVIEELKLRAKDTDLKVLEKYIEYFSPLKYTTTDEVKAIINDTLELNKHHTTSEKHSEDHDYDYNNQINE